MITNWQNNWQTVNPKQVAIKNYLQKNYWQWQALSDRDYNSLKTAASNNKDALKQKLWTIWNEAQSLLKKAAEARKQKEMLALQPKWWIDSNFVSSLNNQKLLDDTTAQKIWLLPSDKQEFIDTWTYSNNAQQRINAYNQQFWNWVQWWVQWWTQIQWWAQIQWWTMWQQWIWQQWTWWMTTNQWLRVYTAQEIQNEQDPYKREQMITESQNALWQAQRDIKTKWVEVWTYWWPVSQSWQANLISSRLWPVIEWLTQYWNLKELNRTDIEKTENDLNRDFELNKQKIDQAFKEEQNQLDRDLQTWTTQSNLNLQDTLRKDNLSLEEKKMKIQETINEIEKKKAEWLATQAEIDAMNKKANAINDKKYKVEQDLKKSPEYTNLLNAQKWYNDILNLAFEMNKDWSPKIWSDWLPELQQDKIDSSKAISAINMLARTQSPWIVTEQDFKTNFWAILWWAWSNAFQAYLKWSWYKLWELESTDFVNALTWFVTKYKDNKELVWNVMKWVYNNISSYRDSAQYMYNQRELSDKQLLNDWAKWITWWYSNSWLLTNSIVSTN